jgi:phospho-N-acetylmuramoyl-pentapeptide-transferase
MLLELARWLQGFARFFALFDYITMRAILGALTALALSLWLGPGVIRAWPAQGRAADPQGWPAVAFLQGRHADHGRRADPAGDPAFGAAVGRPAQPLRVGVAGRAGGLRRDRLVDDWIKIVRRDPNGLKSRHKYALQSMFGLGAAVFLYLSADVPAATTLYLPLLQERRAAAGRLGFIVLAYFWIVGFSNAVNLTDGLDGLAIMPTVLVASALGVFAYASGNAVFSQYLQIPAMPGAGEMVIFCAAIAGAGWASSGSTPIRRWCSWVTSARLRSVRALGTIAVIVRQEAVLLVMGGIFVIETLSVMIQVASFKLTGKRVFRMAPIHHHFELKGWPEPRVIVRFWIISVMLVLVGLATLKVR